MIFCVFLLVVLQVAFCAVLPEDPPPAYTLFDELAGEPSVVCQKTAACKGADLPREHMAFIQYRSSKGTLYDALWNTLGFMAEKDLSVEAALEKGLLAAQERYGSFHSKASAVQSLLHNDFGSFCYCLSAKHRMTYGFSGGKPLPYTKINRIFSKYERRQWEILPMGYDYKAEELDYGELRILTPLGGFRCTPTPVRVQFVLDPQSLRAIQLKEEGTVKFLDKVRILAQEKAQKMWEMAKKEEGQIVIKRVDCQGQLHAIVWDSRKAFDINKRSAGDFFRTCVLQGAHLGYTENEERHYAFYNKGIRRVLKAHVLQDLKKTRLTKPFQDMTPLVKKDFVNIPLTWTETFGEDGPQPGDVDMWFLTFGGVTLKGCKVFTPMSVCEAVGPRNYLKALNYDKSEQSLLQIMSWLNWWNWN